ncbi:helix-turn-helix domain-containing protein [Nocardia sp. NPDC050718]|uniref:PucR family transcriptional regulator n=1 Tax=Nocardia sp. NPDC050718 TaxID=3155788 RepID=UPI00340F74DD
MHTTPPMPALELGPRRRKAAARVAALIAEVDPELNEMAADLTRLYRDSIPVYDQVDAGSIETNTRAVLRIVVGQLGEDDAAQAGFDELTTLARSWADQQIPLDLVAHSLQIGARRIFELIRRRAAAHGVPAAEIDEMQDLTWEWATASATAIHRVLRERAVTGAARRADFLRSLVDGTVAPAILRAEAREHRLDPAHRYRIACAAWNGTAAATDLLAALRARGSTTRLPVVDTVVDQHLVALLPRTPDTLPEGSLVAVGSAVPLGDAATSYREARRAFDLAMRHGRSGLVDLGSLGPLPLLGEAEDIARLLADKHLAPLRRHGGADEILGTVGTYLDCDQRIDDTAARLYLHRNTVRNRLTRFAELTGLDLGRTDDLIVAWWLLHRDPGAHPPSR